MAKGTKRKRNDKQESSASHVGKVKVYISGTSGFTSTNYWQTLSPLESIPMELFDMITSDLPVFSLLALRFVSHALHVKTQRFALKNQDRKCWRHGTFSGNKRSCTCKIHGYDKPMLGASSWDYNSAITKLEAKMFKRQSPQLLTCCRCYRLKPNCLEGFNDAQFEVFRINRICIECESVSCPFKVQGLWAFLCRYCRQAKELQRPLIGVIRLAPAALLAYSFDHPLFDSKVIKRIRRGTMMCSSCHENIVTALEVVVVSSSARVKGWRHATFASGELAWEDDLGTVVDTKGRGKMRRYFKLFGREEEAGQVTSVFHDPVYVSDPESYDKYLEGPGQRDQEPDHVRERGGKASYRAETSEREVSVDVKAEPMDSGLDE